MKGLTKVWTAVAVAAAAMALISVRFRHAFGHH